ncbi:MAG: FliM/FliN family flagellar motor switch protein [Vicinamibacteraceae bacterium]
MSALVNELVQAVSTRFAGVMQSVVTPEAEALPFDGAVAPGWLVPCELAGPMSGTWYLAITNDDAANLASRVLMKESASPDEIGEALKELTAQAFSGIGMEAPFNGLTVNVGKPATSPVAPGAAAGSFACRLDETNTLYFGCSYAAGSAPARPTAVPTLVATAADTAPVVEKMPDNLELILDIDMPLTVRFGEAVVSIEALSRLGPGSLVELSRQPDDPVEVLINGRLVARGEVVVVAGNYGVRVTQVVSPDERLRTLNG